MDWLIAAAVVLFVIVVIVAVERRGKRKRATGADRKLRLGADPKRDGVHPSHGSWMGGTGG